jgi:hypothetical protein
MDWLSMKGANALNLDSLAHTATNGTGTERCTIGLQATARTDGDGCVLRSSAAGITEQPPAPPCLCPATVLISISWGNNPRRMFSNSSGAQIADLGLYESSY